MTSTSRRVKRPLWLLGLAGIVAAGLTALLIGPDPVGQPLNWASRATALLGYLAVFLSIMSSAYLKELTRYFGRPFVQVHHALAISGLVLISLHPLFQVLLSGSLTDLLPRFDSLEVFLTLGGRPAWYLIALAAIVAFLRKAVGNTWRTIHLLNYLAFWLGTAHLNLIGTSAGQYLVVTILSLLMAILAGLVLIRRRIPARNKT